MVKVISLKEPFASLVSEEKKHIETRSWKTNYRGELYIHASLSKVDFKDEKIKKLSSLLVDKNMKYGLIIAKCNLAHCQLMDEAFINKINQNPQEKACGIYEVGRYAWLLDNITVLEQPIAAKGKLGIWNI